MSGHQESTDNVASSVSMQQAQEQAVIAEQMHLVNAAQWGSRDQVLVDAQANMSALFIKHIKERKELEDRHNEEVLAMQMTVNDKLTTIGDQAHLTRLQLENQAANLKRRREEAARVQLDDEELRRGAEFLSTLSTPARHSNRDGYQMDLNTTPCPAESMTDSSGPSMRPEDGRRRSLPSSSTFDENIRRRIASRSTEGAELGSDWHLNQFDPLSSTDTYFGSSLAINQPNPHLQGEISSGTSHTRQSQADRYSLPQPLFGGQDDSVALGPNPPSTQSQLSPTLSLPRRRKQTAQSTPSAPTAQSGQYTVENRPSMLAEPQSQLELPEEQTQTMDHSQTSQAIPSHTTPHPRRSGTKRRRVDVLSEDESESALTSKSALASQSTLQGSDNEPRKSPKLRREMKEEEMQGFVTRMISYLPLGADNQLDVTWRDGVALQLNYVKQIFEPFLGVERRAWICHDMVLDNSWDGKVFYHQKSGRFEAYRKSGARLRVLFKDDQVMEKFMQYYKPMFKDRVVCIKERYGYAVHCLPKLSCTYNG